MRSIDRVAPRMCRSCSHVSKGSSCLSLASLFLPQRRPRCYRTTMGACVDLFLLLEPRRQQTNSLVQKSYGESVTFTLQQNLSDPEPRIWILSGKRTLWFTVQMYRQHMHSKTGNFQKASDVPGPARACTGYGRCGVQVLHKMVNCEGSCTNYALTSE